MVIFLKFAASWVLPPGIFIVAFFALAVYLWRLGVKRAAKILFIINLVFYLLCTGLVADILVGSLESKYEPPENPTGDVIIMLGGGAMPDSPDVDGIGALTASPASRLLTAVRLQRKLHVPILISGGQVYEDSGNEAKIATRVLLSLGVPDDMIITETRSVNTTQNAHYSAELLRARHLNHPIIVTSAFHMNRAMLSFRQAGIEATPYPADYLVSHHPVFHYTKLRPYSEALLNNVTVMQEWLRTFVVWAFKF